MSQTSRADIIFGPGGTLTSAHRSEERDVDGISVLKMRHAIGLELDTEIVIFKFLTLNIGGLYLAGSGRSQFNFQSTRVDALETSSLIIAGLTGPRLRFLNFTRFKMFIGGGYLFGSHNLAYSEEDYEDKMGNTTNFESNDSASFRGHYLETGMEYVMTNASALRLMGRRLKYETNKFRTLDDKELTMTQFQGVVQYLHYLNWDFFWK